KPASITISGQRSDGAVASCAVHIPRAFPYALMKLAALRDRVHDARKQEGRHHAMDLYRIVGMLTEEEESICAALAAQFRGDPKLDEAIETVDALFAHPSGLGHRRLLEYQRDTGSPATLNPDWLTTELRRLLTL